MGFYPTLGKKINPSVSDKCQITESKIFPGWAFFLGNCHFYKFKLKLGRFSVSDLKEQSQNNLLHIYKSISYTRTEKLFLSQALFCHLSTKPYSPVVNFTAGQ